jgi:hypothetical protein
MFFCKPVIKTRLEVFRPRMALGEKATEEKGKATGMSIKSVGPEGVTFELSFVSEIKGIGRFPSGRSMGTITAVQGSNTHKATGQGVFVTTDGESLPWHMLDIGRQVGSRVKCASLVTYSTRSQKYGWMNDVLHVLDGDAPVDLSEFTTTGYEWK